MGKKTNGKRTLAEIKKNLETSLLTNQFGCKIDKINVQMPSDIAIDTFYETDLLFHDIRNVDCFAERLVKDIEKDLNEVGKKPSPEPQILLLGYENYSYLLLSEIKKRLAAAESLAKEENITVLIDTQSKGGRGNYFEALCEEKIRAILRCFDKTGEEKVPLLCYTIVPIGVTMGVFYEMRERLCNRLILLKKEQKCSGESLVCQGKDCDSDCIRYRKNYCIVAVGDEFSTTTDNPSEPYNKYIQSVKKEKDDFYKAVLSPEKENKSIDVKYLLPVSANWYDLIENEKKIENLKKHLPLIKVDSTESLLNMAYQTPMPKKVLDYYLQDNSVSAGKLDKIEFLDPKAGNDFFVRHAHICRGDNHYEFYFDFEKIAEKQEKEIQKWVKELKAQNDKTDEKTAYNVIVSPLQPTNGLFLKTVIENYFDDSHTPDLIHINILQTPKEAIRTKFDYILERIRKEQKPYHINFYYVDDSVTSGETIERAFKFVQLLCDHAGIDISSINHGESNLRFKKVFLLVNRSSYETAHNWVKDPGCDWKGFINIFVPSYNTGAGQCPGCRTRERFGLLGKRSATSVMAQQFFKQENKHKPRTIEEYNDWLDEQIKTDPGYFHWFVMWLNYHANATSGDNPELKSLMEEYLKPNNEKKKVKEQIKEFAEFCQKEKEIEAKIVFDTAKRMVMRDHYLRLQTLNEAYKRLVYKCQNEVRGRYEGSDAGKEDLAEQKYIYKTILDLLTEDNNEDRTAYGRIMQLISYVKVISREQLSRNYIIRGVMIDIMKVMFRMIAWPKERVSEEQNRIKSFRTNLKRTVLEDADYLLSVFKSLTDDEKKDILENYSKLFGIIRNKAGESAIIVPALQYRLFKLLTHRLAMMGSPFILDQEITKQFAKIVKDKKEEEKEEDPYINRFLSLQWDDNNAESKNRAVNAYCESIKTATMAEKNLYLAFKLSEFLESLNKPTDSISESDVEKGIAQTISDNFVLENTLMLYSLMDELYRKYDFEMEMKSTENTDGEEGFSGRKQLYSGKGGLTQRRDNFTDLKKFLERAVSAAFDTKGWHRQNHLSKYFKYYDDTFLDGKASLLSDSTEETTKSKGEKERFVAMFNYYRTLRYLTDESFEDERKKASFHERLQYYYEDLCLSIAQMTGYDSAYIVYHEKGEDSELVTRSGYYFKDRSDFRDQFSSVNISAKMLDALCLLTVRILGKKKNDWKQNEEELFIQKELGEADLSDWLPEKDCGRNTISESVFFSLSKMIDEGIKRHDFLVIKLDFPILPSDKESENSNRKFFIILDRDRESGAEQKNVSEAEKKNAAAPIGEGEASEESIRSKVYEEHSKTVLRILFMRNRLLSALQQDYATLIDFRYDCGYIQPLVNKDSRILHISDLHVEDKFRTEEQYLDQTEKCFSAIKEASETKEVSQEIDLIAVTGDLIDHADSASEAQRRYAIVHRILTTIAVKLWGVEEESKGVRLPHDWKRRFLIVPGNHDYTAMNDVSIELDSVREGRRIKAGFPASSSGGTMSKLTYYIEFMMNFLDAPIDELIANDMNEVRQYKQLGMVCKNTSDKMGLGVCLLNSVSKSNAKQTNKVAFDSIKIKNMLNRHQEDLKTLEKTVLVIHHSLDYNPDYFADKYLSFSQNNLGELNTLFGCTYYAFEALLRNVVFENDLFEQSELKGRWIKEYENSGKKLSASIGEWDSSYGGSPGVKPVVHSIKYFNKKFICAGTLYNINDAIKAIKAIHDAKVECVEYISKWDYSFYKDLYNYQKRLTEEFCTTYHYYLLNYITKKPQYARSFRRINHYFLLNCITKKPQFIRSYRRINHYYLLNYNTKTQQLMELFYGMFELLQHYMDKGGLDDKAAEFIRGTLAFSDMLKIKKSIEHSSTDGWQFKNESNADEYVQDILYRGRQMHQIQIADFEGIKEVEKAIVDSSSEKIELAGHIHNNERDNANHRYRVARLFEKYRDTMEFHIIDIEGKSDYFEYEKGKISPSPSVKKIVAVSPPETEKKSSKKK